MNRRDVGVILVAAGRSSRMGGGESKVWLELEGAPLLAHSLRAVAAFDRLAELALVVRDGDRGRATSVVGAFPELTPRTRVVAGGAGCGAS